jgi:outer membrane protein
MNFAQPRFPVIAIFSLCIAIAFGIVSSNAVAQDIPLAKIAVLEMRTIERDALAWKDLRKKFKEENDKLLKELEALQSSLAEEGQALQQQQNILSSEARAQKRAEFQARVQSVNQQANKKRLALEKALLEGRNQILEKLRGEIISIAKDQGYNLILDRSNSDTTIVLALPEIVITETVVERLNEKIQSVDFTVTPVEE